MELVDFLSELIEEEVFTFFLGFHKSFDCKKLEDEQKKDICYLGAGVSKKSTTMCKKIESASVKSFCAGSVAQQKKKIAYCTKVFGTVEQEGKETSLQSVQIRNCYLSELLKNGKSEKDCKQFKKSFLFFFSKSTPTYQACVEGVGK